MSNNDRKKGFLQKKNPYHKMREEDIQMEIFDQHTLTNQKNSPAIQPSHYYILEDHKPNNISLQQLRKNHQISHQKPYNDKIISLNGQTFKLIENKGELNSTKKKSKIPTMLVSCYRCKTVQSVQGTSNVFECGVCHIRNECVPVYGILRCTSCSSKVLYSIGQSDFIKCTKCTTINQVTNQVREARGSSNMDPTYQIYYNHNEKPLEYTPNPYVRNEKLSELEELISQEYQQRQSHH